MFSQSNYLPQISQIGFNPQPTVPQVDQYRNAVISQQLFDAPLRRAIQVAQLEQQQFSNQLALKNLEFREQEFEFKKELNNQQLEEAFELKRAGVLKQANDLTGIEFANENNRIAFEDKMKAAGLNLEAFTSLIDGDQLQVKDMQRQLQAFMFDPEVRELMKTEEAFNQMLKSVAEKPAAYDLNRVNQAVDDFSMGNGDFRAKDFAPANYLTRVDPTLEFLTKEKALIEAGGVDTPAVEERYVLKAAEHGIPEATARAQYAEFSMRNFDSVAEGARYAEMAGTPEMAPLFTSWFEQSKQGGKGMLNETVNFVNEKVVETVLKEKADTAISKNDIWVEEEKARIEREGQVSDGSSGSYDIFNSDGKLNAGSQNFNMFGPTEGGIVLSTDGTGLTREGAVVPVDMGGATVMQMTPWSEMTPEQAIGITASTLATNSKVVSKNPVRDATRQALRLDNEMPISWEHATSNYSQVTGDIKIAGEVVKKAPNAIYFRDPLTGKVATNDMQMVLAAKFIGGNQSAASNFKNIEVNGKMEKFGVITPDKAVYSVGQSYQEAAMLVAAGESVNAGGYDAYWIGDYSTVGNKNPLELTVSTMTIGQIKDLQSRAGEGQMASVGQYQIEKGTLPEAAAALGYGDDVVFTPQVQDDIFHNHLIMGKKRGDVRDYIRGVAGASEGAAMKALMQEFSSFRGEPDKASAFLETYKKAYDADIAAADDLKYPIRKQPTDAFGISGQTGYSTGPHIDIRYVDGNAKPLGVPGRDFVDSVMVGGKPLSSHELTQAYGNNGHGGVDYSVMQNRELTFANPELVESVVIRKDSGGITAIPQGKNTSGGLYADVMLRDGRRFFIMHLSPLTVIGESAVPTPEGGTVPTGLQLNSTMEKSMDVFNQAREQAPAESNNSVQIPEEVRDSLRTAYQNVQW